MRNIIPAGAALLLLAGQASAQDYHFSKQLPVGARLDISNISGAIDVERASGRTAEVTVSKTVRRGDGNLVKAIIDEGSSGLRVCTIYLNRRTDTTHCDADERGNKSNDHLEVEMHYVVRVPAGVKLSVDDVNGSISATGIDADASLNTVNGDVMYEGTSANRLETVNGKVVARLARASWSGAMSVQTVNGSVELTFPSDLSADVHGETVNGGIDSQFPITIEGKWGPKSFSGRIGNGGGKLTIETVNGGITLRKR